VTSTGAGFASERECVIYAAHGGPPLSRYQYLQSQYQAICEQRGLFFLNGEDGWGCRSSVGALTQDSYDALSTPCQQAGGTPRGTASHGEYVVIYCDSIDRGLAAVERTLGLYSAACRSGPTTSRG